MGVLKYGLGAILVAIIILFLFWRFIFLRDPERTIPTGKDLIVSPADGRVLKIMEFSNKDNKSNSNKNGSITISKGALGKIHTITKDVADEGYIVSIFMSPLNVHVNRAPIAGKVLYSQHTKGKFFAAYDFEKSLENEKNEILISGKNNTKVKAIQIAGFVARRIESFVQKDSEVKIGERIGLINLGSQVTLILPKNVKLNVSEGDKVLAGETIIGRFD